MMITVISLSHAFKPLHESKLWPEMHQLLSQILNQFAISNGDCYVSLWQCNYNRLTLLFDS